MIHADRFAATAMPHFAGMLAVLSLVAWLAPAPYPTDQAMMEKVGQGVIVPGCSDLNCFRILVPATLEALPGPTTVRWRGFAVVCNAAAAIATAYLALVLGLPGTTATWAGWLAATGAGAFSTVYHPYNADPFVLMLAPIITALLLRHRWWAATALSAIGVFAKEFAAAPLYVAAAASALAREWREAMRQLLLAAGVTGLWIVLQLSLMVLFNYSYNENPSSQPLAGGYLRLWLTHVTPLSALAALFGAYGALYVLLPIGWRLAPARLKQLAVGALPAAAAFVYVATPERALWNFYFLVVPIAAIALDRLPVLLSAAFVAAFAIANMRIGGQLTVVPSSRYAVAITIALALLAVWRAPSLGRTAHA